jgi:hypothetical protein
MHSRLIARATLARAALRASSPVKHCGCGATHDREAWRSLPLAGIMVDGDELLELRNCRCGSTIALPLQLELGTYPWRWVDGADPSRRLVAPVLRQLRARGFALEADPLGLRVVVGATCGSKAALSAGTHCDLEAGHGGQHAVREDGRTYTWGPRE